MNILWNSQMGRFEAQFTDFENDQPAVKTAGFRTDGPPSWAWWTIKIDVLHKLRKNKPPSGLFLTDEALAAYKPLAEMHAKNEETKKLLKKAKTEAAQERVGGWLPAGKETLGPEDLAPHVSVRAYVPPEPPATRCLVCGDPTYVIYELEHICLWCEIQDEKIFENSA